MKIIGIIAEFNPFHNGHDYILRTAKEMSGADHCVVVMSGDFVQRGEPAICDKFLRTRMALLSSADAVFELPGIYARASAEQFAYGAVLLLSSLGCIDEIYFGSESGDTKDLLETAKILTDEPAEYRGSLSYLLKSGLSFPSAREKALKEYLGGKISETGSKDAGSFPHTSSFSDTDVSPALLDSIENGLLSSPNNILAVEYCKALLRLQAAGTEVPSPVAVRRRGSSYDSAVPDTVSDASALAIRNFIKNGSIESAKPFMPASAYEILSREYNRSFPIYADDFSSVLYSSLLFIKSAFNIQNHKKISDRSGSSRISDTPNMMVIPDTFGTSDIPSVPDMSGISDTSNMSACPGFPGIPADLLNAIIKNSDDPLSFTRLIEAVKTKNVTYSAISRALISILLDTADLSSFISGETVSLESPGITYARLLGIRKDSSALIRRISETARCKIINKLADARISDKLLEADIRAARLYNQIIYQKFGTRLPDEYRKTIELI